jgi:integrase
MINAGGVWWIEISSTLGEGRRYCLGVPGFAEASRIAEWEGETMVIRELEDALMVDYDLKARPEKTRKQAQHVFGVFRHFGATIKVLRVLDDITTQILTQFAQWRLQDHVSGTVLYELKILRRALQVLCDWGKILRVPRLPPVSPSAPRQGFISDQELEKVCRVIEPTLEPFVRFLSLTGWRAGEAQKLAWKGVDFNIGIVRLEPGTTKTKQGREFPFRYLRPLEAVLRKQRDEVTRLELLLGQVIPWVFPRRSGGPIKRYDWSWHKACREVGLAGRVIHDFRRSAVRRLHLAGVPIPIGMKLTGHRSMRVYLAYAVSGPQDLEDGVRRLDAFMGRQKVCHEKSSLGTNKQW